MLCTGSEHDKVDLRYLGLQVSHRHLQEQSQQQLQHLMGEKKLVVVFDLDHTLLHTELKTRLKAEVLLHSPSA